MKKAEIGFLVAIFLIITGVSVFAETSAVTEAGEKVILFPDGTYRKGIENKIDNGLELRIQSAGNNFSASESDLKEAYSLAVQGWRYTLPQPKSRQSAWGNSDGRTTWWYGYWRNIETNEYSSRKPELGQSGMWIGNGQNQSGYYRRGGSPTYPSKVELILSALNH